MYVAYENDQFELIIFTTCNVTYLTNYVVKFNHFNIYWLVLYNEINVCA